jgi:small-conductance mechanosensitive channel
MLSSIRVFALMRRIILVGPFLALLALLPSGSELLAQRPLQDKNILQFLNRTIRWYRNVAATAQSPRDSRAAIASEGLVHSSRETLRSAFEFARAQAAIPSSDAAGESPDAARSRTLAQSAAVAEQQAAQAQAKIEELNRRLGSASGGSRARLEAQRNEAVSEVNFAKARRDALRNFLAFLSAPDEGGLAARVAELEHAFPEAAAGQKPAAEPPTPRVAGTQSFQAASAGIIGLTTELISVSQDANRLDQLAQQTETLRQSAEALRAPLRTALREVIRRGDAKAKEPDAADIAAIDAKRKELDALTSRFKQLSASSAPLSEVSSQLGDSRSRILEWRDSLGRRRSTILRYLLLRLGSLALGLLVIFGLSEVWRRATMRYVQDLRRRRQFLLLRRIVAGCAAVLFVVLSFVTEFGSLATFAGFSAAGIAVAMQSVLVSVVAYFFLVGRWGVRIGDRVTVSGVTGEVVDIGLFRLYLMELGGSGLALRPTGRIVVFPNAIFFQPGAVFKQMPGIEYAWRTIKLKLSGAADYGLVEKRLLAAVESIYSEYREAVERQHKTAQSSLDLHTPPPHPETELHFMDSGLELTIRYPVEIRRAAEIDDRIAREIAQQIQNDPSLKQATGGALNIEATA